MKKFECKGTERCRVDSPCRFEVENDSDAPIRCPYYEQRPAWVEVGATIKESLQVPLPRLTAEALKERGIEWPDWAGFAVVNGDGHAYFHEEKPRFDGLLDANSWLIYGIFNIAAIPGEWDATDWQNSLIERPVEFPVWLKVGVWVKVVDIPGGDEFHKIKKIGEGLIVFEGNMATSITSTNLKPARLRPWTDVEMKQQVGAVFVFKGGIYMALGLEDGELIFQPRDSYAAGRDSEELADRGTMLDGGPCGVLEVVE